MQDLLFELVSKIAHCGWVGMNAGPCKPTQSYVPALYTQLWVTAQCICNVVAKIFRNFWVSTHYVPMVIMASKR